MRLRFLGIGCRLIVGVLVFAFLEERRQGLGVSFNRGIAINAISAEAGKPGREAPETLKGTGMGM